MCSEKTDPDSCVVRQLPDKKEAGLGHARTGSSSDNMPTTIEPSSKLVLYRDGQSCIATVPELPGCVVRGTDYFDALKRLQQALRDCSNGLQPDPSEKKKILDTLDGFLPRSNPGSCNTRRSLPIKSRLIEKFGARSNRELAACIGIICADAPIMLSAAMAGNGTRKVRCAIAIALSQAPSSLWPARAPDLSRSDDDFYHSSTRNRRGTLKQHARVG